MAEPSGRVGHPRVHLRRTGSTNDRARALASAGAPSGAIITTFDQTAGRGRQGRTWVAPPGRTLALSVLLRDPVALLPLRAGLAVADLAGADARVKWPNDVLVGERKVAGVLVEARPAEGWAVLGIGVNVAVAASDFPPELRASAGTLGRGSDELEPALAELLAALRSRLEEAQEATIRALRARDALLDRSVQWAEGEGVGAGIDPDGALLVRRGDGHITALDAGEVHLGLTDR